MKVGICFGSMPRPPSSMQKLSETAPDDRIRRIARRAHEAGLSFPEFAEALGRTDRGSLLTTFKSPRHHPSTIGKYAQVCGLWSERQIAALLDTLSDDDINMTLAEMLHILEVQSPYSVEQFQRIRKNLQELSDVEKQQIAKEFLLEHKHCFLPYSAPPGRRAINKAWDVQRLATINKKGASGIQVGASYGCGAPAPPPGSSRMPSSTSSASELSAVPASAATE